jgi:hypothetical protein
MTMSSMAATDDSCFTSLTPLAFLERSAEVFPAKEAIVYGTRRITYAEFAAEATRVANALRACGVRPGDRVAYLLPNIPEMLIAHFAVPLAGAVLVAINTRLAPAEIGYILRHSGAKVLVVDTALRASLPSGLELSEIVTVTDPAFAGSPDCAVSGISYEELLARGNDRALPWTVEDERGPPKSRASCRTIALDEAGTRRLVDQAVKQAIELLRHQFTDKRYPDRRARTGPGWRRGRPMFTYADGRSIRPEYLTHRFREICKELGLPPIRLHDLRHCAATLALASHTDLKVIQQMLGHSSIVTTADTYTSVLPEAAHRAAQATADMVIKAARTVPGARADGATVTHIPASGYCQM